MFPFTAAIGQDEIEQALLIAAVEPTIGGVLVFGDRGTGSTARIERRLTEIFPP
jgi:magnesium chelatase subunit I